MPRNPQNEKSTPKSRLELKREPEELVIEEDFEDDDSEVTVAQSAGGESLTLLEEYKKRSGSSYRWTLAFSAACAITSVAFTLMTLQKV